ncbi:MAG: type II toxin-antitoxin system HicB family antitoxin [Colwellia sp.]|nr:type II toxin-antitoxin system HicB family antitoxin [Colwellia sp.]
MKYPVLITVSEVNDVYQLSVPDLPGCQIKAETIDSGMQLIEEAIASHLNILAEYGESIPHAKNIDHHIKTSTETAPIWAIIDFDIVPYLGKSHKINVTLPELLIKQIDDRVSKSPVYKTRSGFIASACVIELAK